MIIIPIEWLFHWEYTQHFQTNPQSGSPAQGEDFGSARFWTKVDPIQGPLTTTEQYDCSEGVSEWKDPGVASGFSDIQGCSKVIWKHGRIHSKTYDFWHISNCHFFFLERVNISLNPDFVLTVFLPKLWRECQVAGSLVGLEAAVVLWAPQRWLRPHNGTTLRLLRWLQSLGCHKMPCSTERWSCVKWPYPAW